MCAGVRYSNILIHKKGLARTSILSVAISIVVTGFLLFYSYVRAHDSTSIVVSAHNVDVFLTNAFADQPVNGMQLQIDKICQNKSVS